VWTVLHSQCHFSLSFFDVVRPCIFRSQKRRKTVILFQTLSILDSLALCTTLQPRIKSHFFSPTVTLFPMYDFIKRQDPEVYASLHGEYDRQSYKLELIASENYVSPAVLEAQGSLMTNKYAEGYPGRRYYGGCEWVDVAETLAIDRAKALFGAEYANVQPHSGTTANMAVYFSFLNFGDTVMGMDLSHGGHLTHGSPVNFSGKFYNFVPYGIDEKMGLIDYNRAADLAKQHKPKMITVGASAYSRNIDYKAFREIADSVGAFLFADIAHPAGLIAKGHLDTPVPYAHVVATTTHKTLRGPRAGLILLGKDFENPFGITMAKSGRTKMMSEVIDSWVIPGVQGGALMHVVAAKAVAFKEALTDDFKEYTAQIIRNARALATALSSHGYNIASGGTDNHLMLIDLRNKNITGKDAQLALDEAGITCNKNAVPFDDKPPLITSGIRLGTPALTTRGMKEADMERVAEFIHRVLSSMGDEGVKTAVKADVKEFCGGFPLTNELQNLAHAGNGIAQGLGKFSAAADAKFERVEDVVEQGVEKALEATGDFLSSVGKGLKNIVSKP
jgi:glycine hydroxymethyltransferase